MMDARSGGEQAQLAETMASFEGLVRKTAFMYASQVRRDPEDVEQELRLRVWRAIETFDPRRGRQSLERYVFSAVTNKIKDYKRDAAREAQRRERYGITFVDYADVGVLGLYHGYINHGQVLLDDESFELPETVTQDEAYVLVLLVVGYSRVEVATEVGRTRGEIDNVVRDLRVKLADWRPRGAEPVRDAIAA